MPGPQPPGRFADRRAAGRALGRALAALALPDPVVLGLPRGGVVVAAEVAAALGAPLDVVVVRKVGVPWRPELAMGAVGEGDILVRDEQVIGHAGVEPALVEREVGRQRALVARRAADLRTGRGPVAVAGRTAVLVDDGIATGSTARAACLVVRRAGPARLLLAAPVGPPDVQERFADVADEVLCLVQPRRYAAVGQVYDDFGEVSDAQVAALLRAGPGGSGR